MIILDTNILSELIRPQPAARPLAWVDEQPAAALAITAITVAELRYGVARLPDGARKDALVAALGALLHEEFSGRVLPFDDRAAELYGDIVADRERRGRPIGMADGQVAAICRSRSAALATRNVRDFEATGVRLVDPWSASP